MNQIIVRSSATFQHSFNQFDLEVPLNDVIQLMNDDGSLVSIIGDPGFGKTIQLGNSPTSLLQISLKIQRISFRFMLKQNHFQRTFRLTTSPFGFSFGDSENSTEYHGNSTSSKEEAVEIFIQSMLETEPELDEGIVRNMFSMQQNVSITCISSSTHGEILSEDRRMEIVFSLMTTLSAANVPSL